MARIVLITKDAQVLAKTRQAVKKYELIELEDLTPSVPLAEAAGIIMANKPAVVLMDYWSEDAASVKLMQSLAEHNPWPAFIFIDQETEADRSELLMAFNEGATAFLAKSFNPLSLANYIERAIKGPGRMRCQEPLADKSENDGLEEAMGDLRIKTARFQKLISNLLSNPVSASARKTLVVSDSLFQRELLKKILEEHNFNTIAAPGFDEGLKLAEEEKPRTIISDLELVGKSGLELCRAVKFKLKLIPCHFVICTASPDKAAQIMTPGNGVDDCLLKPLGRGDADGFISRIALGLLL